ncbi:MAG: signal recognition particle-docking protein FtsY [Candidatus Cloacimonetes bacterium]|jgi:fused signal recognition particle receptor|nr:signal recognition particle-docking protein FtsY [Candidatus Cloacimonadota bacterium]MDD2506833.1 signal recognition particle-docking protein FtsY [Candidatus Cloacimonadota bacterium]MDD4559934.1 signal recognition particle-docking protein FtsY [Candidatus Cloacimonadota bacterium]
MLSKLKSLRDKLTKSKSGFIDKIAETVRVRGVIDDELYDELEEILIKNDTGTMMAEKIISSLRKEVKEDKITDPEVVQIYLVDIMQNILFKDIEEERDFFNTPALQPYVIAFVGVNGTGKTTTIGKVANLFAKAGKKVLIIAGDTFRAAAIEQVAIWAERAGVEIMRSEPERDPASVIYDGVASAVAKKFDIVLIDTAGRQHTKDRLMKELQKIDRVIKKACPDAPHETILVVDSTTGQNAISQAKHFNESIKLTGIALTKFDGTAKGGIIFNIKENLEIPVRLLGVGEQIDDIENFHAVRFVKAFFSKEAEPEAE